jgi:putative membrane protein insertion efficiency factor
LTRFAERLRGVAVAGLVAPIRLYRLVISPLFPPACRFQPTCSQYAIEAIQTHGPAKGLGLAMRRLARCHPITWLGGSSGYDPVPPR